LIDVDLLDDLTKIASPFLFFLNATCAVVAAIGRTRSRVDGEIDDKIRGIFNKEAI